MSNFFYPGNPKDKRIPIQQVHPRVLKEEHECCDCTHAVNPLSTSIFCTLHDEQRNNHDCCSAFTVKDKKVNHGT